MATSQYLPVVTEYHLIIKAPTAKNRLTPHEARELAIKRGFIVDTRTDKPNEEVPLVDEPNRFLERTRGGILELPDIPPLPMGSN